MSVMDCDECGHAFNDSFMYCWILNDGVIALFCIFKRIALAFMMSSRS